MGVRDPKAEAGVDSRGGLDARALHLARAQHGVVTRGQLLALGMGTGAIQHRLREGRLAPMHRGVYLIGPGPGRRALEIGAVLACRGTTLLSHDGACRFWSFLPYPREARPISVTVLDGDCRSRRGIRVHHAAGLERGDWMVRDSIPVTSPARTLLDLAAVAPFEELERALAEAQVIRLVSERRLRDQVERNRGRRGAGALRRALDAEGGPKPTRGEFERRLLRLIRAARLPVPEANVRVGPHEVDFHWPRERLVVEADGFAYHSSRRAFERDRRRDADLAARGQMVIRVTWRRLTHEPEAVVAAIAGALATRR